MRRVRSLQAYEVVKDEWIEELNSRALVCRHKKSGARLFLLSNDDKNKVFMIGFRTPPADSTGVPHILEHSVLCGSRKFPAKDPFVELVKGSLNTFLNAMTYPDKTVYPIASCNDKDFQNLMDVYMDAVLHPNICANEKIFLQEGWHYELEEEDAPLKINGVVYNEMIGAYSQPESMLEAQVGKALFPDTCYSRDSGGDPEAIPDLTYEGFQDFYHRYYHPSNSYIYLYGDMDMAEKLAWLDEAYLKEYERQDIDSEIPFQKPFDAPVERAFYYPLTDEEEEGQTYLSWNAVVGTDLDPKLYVAFQILEYAILTAPGAPLKQALLDAGIGKDVLGGYNNGVLQPYFSVIAKNAEDSQKEPFLKVVKEELERLAKEGINRKSLLAGLNYYEFKYREADYGSFPKGLMYGLQCFDSWLYDETEPLMHLAYGESFRFLHRELENGYFESLIREYLLDNPHQAVVTARPKKGLNEEKDAALAQRLAEFKDSLSQEARQELVQKTHELQAYQETPNTPQELAKIPMLAREDIDQAIQPLNVKESEQAGVTVLHHEMFTAGIGYLRLLFNIEAVADEDLPCLGLLRTVLGYMDTKKYGYRELFNEVYIQTGGISMGLNTYTDEKDGGRYRAMFEVTARTFYEKIDVTLELIREMLKDTVFEDEKRLREIVAENKSRAQMRLMSAGHSAAVLRATSYFSQTAQIGEQTGGIGYYKYLEDLDAHFDEKKDETIARLKKLTQQLFTADRLLVSYTADEEGFAGLKQELPGFVKELYAGGWPAVKRELPREKKNEGFLSSSGVQYVAQCGNYKTGGFAYTGALRILKVMLSYDYLWIQLRVKGGAYGCMSGFARTGDSYFVSYRDPHLKNTLAVYQGIPAYLRGFEADEREMTKYIIGTISEMDTPLNPSARGGRSLSAWLCHLTEEQLQKERRQVLTAQPEDIRALAPLMEAILREDSVCVVGSAQKCREDASVLGELRNLFA
ncbi:MAG: insulinase family protein [Lachnospiraceae bacterium]|nr:insulinase family protein [Lachnospiraceae bacterium]